jgi:ribosomal protein L11 methyltransferase
MIMKTDSAQKVNEISLKLPRSFSGGDEILKSVLLQFGVPETEIVEQQTATHISVLVYVRQKRIAEKIRSRFTQLRLAGLDVQVKAVYPKDWLDTWKDTIRPFPLTSKFDVVPLWRKDDYQPSPRIPLIIDTTLSFGTGLHETTRFVALLIEKCEGKFSRFLDVGAGTGILSLIAYYCGACLIDMVDVNEDCVMTAKNNMSLNQVPYHKIFCCDIAGFKSSLPYDMIAANLTSHDLKRFTPVLLSLCRPGGYLALSGIAIEHLDDVRRHFKVFPLRCLKVLKGQSWGALLYKKVV